MRTDALNYFATKLTGEMGPEALVADVETTGGLQAPAYLVIEPRDPDQREVVRFDESFTSTRFSTSTLANRYLQGSAAASGLAHPADAEVWSVPVWQIIEDIYDEHDSLAPTPHGNTHHDPNFATQADHAGHVAATDPHSATAAATPSRLVLRDADARAQFANPSVAADAATKGFADALGTAAPTADTIMRRDGAGRVRAADPSVAADVATKGFIDAVGSRRLYRNVLASAVGTVTIANADIEGLLADWPELEIRILGRFTSADDNRSVQMRFNGDATDSYDTQQVRASGTTASGIQQTAVSVPVLFRLPAANELGGAVFGPGKATILGHDRSAIRTVWVGHSYALWAGTGQSIDVTGGEWRKTNIVTSITLIAQSGNFAVGTEIVVRGIA